MATLYNQSLLCVSRPEEQLFEANTAEHIPFACSISSAL
jgi:hypothetical protein